MIQPGKTYHLDQMSVDEKIDLVNDLWDSLSALPKSEAPTAIDEVAMRAEARRLLDEKIISIEGMGASERIILAEELWDSVRDEPEACRISPEQEAELLRRLSDVEANPQAWSTWEEVKARLEQRP